ncbi:MAG TPA: phage tail protein [Clostridia bacterium]|nr:phage tail protein [Clostridia bacterium]
MIIGAYGSLVFSVSSQKVSTFDNLSLSASYNTETQEVIGKKPSTYKKGPGLDQISYDVTLDQTLGIDVEAEIKKWRDICKSGAVYHMNIGGKNISEFPLMLKSIEIAYKQIGADGKIVKVILSIKLEEYVRAGSAKSTGTGSGAGGVSADVSQALFGPDGTKIITNTNVARAKAGGLALA